MRQLARQPIFWSIMMCVLGLSLLTPLQFITVHLMMVPIVMIVACSATLPLAAAYLSAPSLLLLLLTGRSWLIAAVILVIMVFPGIAIGYMYRRKSSAHAAILAGTITMIAVLILFLVSFALAGVNLQREIRAFMAEQFLLIDTFGAASMVTEEALDNFISIAVRMLPLYIIIVSVYYTVITHTVSRRLLNKLGLEAPSFPPAHEWKLPRSLIWYYLVVLFMNLFLNRDSVLYTFILNLYPILLITFAVQGLAFYFYWAYEKGRSKAIPITAGVCCLLFPPAMYITSLVGVFDTAFPIRQYINRGMR